MTPTKKGAKEQKITGSAETMTLRHVCTATPMGIIPCLNLLLVTLCTGKTSGEPMPCEAGHFVLGQSGNVTCHFSRNMKGSERHIYVVLYPFQAPDSFSGHTILRCSGLNLPKPICRVADGYQFNSDISERLTVTIPVVKNISAGLYVCQLVPPDDRQSRGCNLTVEGTRATETTPVLTTSPYDDGNIVSGSDSINVTGLVIYLFLSTLIVVLLAILLYKWIKRRKTRKGNTEKADSETPAGKPMLPQQNEKESQTGKSLEKMLSDSCHKIETAVSKINLHCCSKMKENAQNDGCLCFHVSPVCTNTTLKRNSTAACFTEALPGEIDIVRTANIFTAQCN
ncbi:uncharacterized protein [Littorina saxatilis]|uniref:uncharacterized protein n=1 Tax=Littorina saxatilis TaxID=31220 RepID=UPI0038B5EA38